MFFFPVRVYFIFLKGGTVLLFCWFFFVRFLFCAFNSWSFETMKYVFRCYLVFRRIFCFSMIFFCQSGLRRQVDLTKYSPREPVIKQALRTETTAIMKGLKWTKHLLKSEKKKKEGKSIIFPQRDYGEGRWLQRFEINKEGHTETGNLSF